MAEQDELNRAYQRGYAAGRRRLKADLRGQRKEAEREAFRRRAFLAALPACIEVQGWVRGDAPITKLADRVRLAWEFADEAVKGAH
jgi:hypothetical protein